MNLQNLFDSTFGEEQKTKESSQTNVQESQKNLKESNDMNVYDKERASPEEINKKIKEEFNLESYKPKIQIIGIGGMGCNVVSKMSELTVRGAETLIMNTDAAHMVMCNANRKFLLGKDVTKGLGAGGEPEIGKKAAEESRTELKELLKDSNLVFLITGLGGGTGTGAAPIIARIAKEQGAVVIGAVTLPFKIEGARISKAEDGLYQLRQCCDTVIVIENQKLLEYGGNLPLKEAFKLGDEVVSQMIKGITETISQPSLVNLDYADVKTIMKAGGVSTIGIGVADSSDRAKEAVSRALKHPLLQVDYSGATGALIQIIGGPDLKLEEVNSIGESVTKHLSPESQTIWGARILDDYEGKVQVITVITGVKSPYILGPTPEPKKGEVQTEVSDSLGIEVFR